LKSGDPPQILVRLKETRLHSQTPTIVKNTLEQLKRNFAEIFWVRTRNVRNWMKDNIIILNWIIYEVRFDQVNIIHIITTLLGRLIEIICTYQTVILQYNDKTKRKMSKKDRALHRCTFIIITYMTYPIITKSSVRKVITDWMVCMSHNLVS
jgi:hypothetical protein